jgi:hypothetical protein
MIGPPPGILFPPMLFARNALTSGPQAYLYPGKKIERVKVGKIQIPLDPPHTLFLY